MFLGRKTCMIHSCGFPGPAQGQLGSRRLRGRCGMGTLVSGLQLLSLLGAGLAGGSQVVMPLPWPLVSG